MVFLQVYTFGVRDGKEERETCPKSAHNRLTGISAPVDATHKSAPGLTVLKIFNTIISLNLSIRHYNTLKKNLHPCFKNPHNYCYICSNSNLRKNWLTLLLGGLRSLSRGCSVCHLHQNLNWHFMSHDSHPLKFNDY